MEQIQEYINNIDKKARAVLLNRRWMDLIESIAVTHNIKPQETDDFKTQVWLTILGITNEKELEDALLDTITLPTKQREAVYKEAKDKILDPIANKLGKLYPQKRNTEIKPNIEKTKLEKPFASQPTKKKVNIEKNQDPYLEPIEESDRI